MFGLFKKNTAAVVDHKKAMGDFMSRVYEYTDQQKLGYNDDYSTDFVSIQLFLNVLLNLNLKAKDELFSVCKEGASFIFSSTFLESEFQLLTDSYDELYYLYKSLEKDKNITEEYARKGLIVVTRLYSSIFGEGNAKLHLDDIKLISTNYIFQYFEFKFNLTQPGGSKVYTKKVEVYFSILERLEEKKSLLLSELPKDMVDYLFSLKHNKILENKLYRSKYLIKGGVSEDEIVKVHFMFNQEELSDLSTINNYIDNNLFNAEVDIYFEMMIKTSLVYIYNRAGLDRDKIERKVSHMDDEIKGVIKDILAG